METLYYDPYGIPNAVRIISDSIGIDATIVPKLRPSTEREDYYAKLVELAKNPQIDLVVVLCEHNQVFCDNGDGGAYALIKEPIEIHSWKFVPLNKCKTTNPAMWGVWKKLCQDRNEPLLEQEET